MYKQYIDKQKYDEIVARHQKEPELVTPSEHYYLWLYKLLVADVSSGERDGMIHRIWTRFPVERKDFDSAVTTLIALIENENNKVT